MEEIIKSLDALAENEFLEKLKERGKFVDSHQAYGVIKEEIEEAEDELEHKRRAGLPLGGSKAR